MSAYLFGVVLDGVLPAEYDTYQQIYHEADRLQRLANDLQELSRVEAGTFKLECRPLAVGNLIQQTATRLHSQFEEKDVQLSPNIPAGLP